MFRKKETAVRIKKLVMIGSGTLAAAALAGSLAFGVTNAMASEDAPSLNKKTSSVTLPASPEDNVLRHSVTVGRDGKVLATEGSDGADGRTLGPLEGYGTATVEDDGSVTYTDLEIPDTLE
jgi:hypothetical protein